MSKGITKSVVEEAALNWLCGVGYEVFRPAQHHRHRGRSVRRIIRKYGYAPDKQAKATQTVLEQAKLLCAEWAV